MRLKQFTVARFASDRFFSSRSLAVAKTARVSSPGNTRVLKHLLGFFDGSDEFIQNIENIFRWRFHVFTDLLLFCCICISKSTSALSWIRENGQPQKALSLLFMYFSIAEKRYVSYHAQWGHDLTLHNQLSTNSKRRILISISSSKVNSSAKEHRID